MSIVDATLQASLYVNLHGGVPGDLAFYRAESQGQSSILELGVGDARVLSQLTATVRVGLDLEPAMLALAARRITHPPLELLQGNMAAPCVKGSFDRVLIPFNGLLCLPDSEKLACLVAARRLLAPGGRLLFDIYFSDELHADSSEVELEPEVDDEEFLVQLSCGEVLWNVFEQNRWFPSKRQIDACYRFSCDGSDAVPAELEMNIVHHYLLAEELGPLLRDAGYRHYSQHLFNEQSEQFGVVAW